MTTQLRIWCVISAAVMAVLGFGGGYWYWSRQTELLHVMDATNRVVLFSNLLRQLERNDMEGARAAHRELVKNAGISLDVLAPIGSRYAGMPEVIAAHSIVQEIDASSR
jgi:hypothetical protein